MADDLAAMRRVATEGIALAAGARAILLQVADPAVARGVDSKSSCAEHPLDRLHALISVTRLIYRRLPKRIRALPSTYSRHSLRRRMGG